MGKPGLYLTAPHADLIRSGEKTLIVKAKRFKAGTDRPHVLVSEGKAYGIIQLKPPVGIGIREFQRLAGKHRIETGEKGKWWPSKRRLWAYEFEFKPYRKLRSVKVARGVQTHIRNVEFAKSAAFRGSTEMTSIADGFARAFLDEIEKLAAKVSPKASLLRRMGQKIRAWAAAKKAGLKGAGLSYLATMVGFPLAGMGLGMLTAPKSVAGAYEETKKKESPILHAFMPGYSEFKYGRKGTSREIIRKHRATMREIEKKGAREVPFKKLTIQQRWKTPETRARALRSLFSFGAKPEPPGERG